MVNRDIYKVNFILGESESEDDSSEDEKKRKKVKKSSKKNKRKTRHKSKKRLAIYLLGEYCTCINSFELVEHTSKRMPSTVFTTLDMKNCSL